MSAPIPSHASLPLEQLEVTPPEREAPPRTGKWSLDWGATNEHMRKAFARTVDDAVPESALVRSRP